MDGETCCATRKGGILLLNKLLKYSTKQQELSLSLFRCAEKARQKEHIEFLAVFGSATRDDFTEQSDIDLIVKFAAGQRVGFLRLLAIQDRLSEIFEGRSVDLHTLREIHPVIREHVQQQLVPIFQGRIISNG